MGTLIDGTHEAVRLDVVGSRSEGSERATQGIPTVAKTEGGVRAGGIVKMAGSPP